MQNVLTLSLSRAYVVCVAFDKQLISALLDVLDKEIEEWVITMAVS